MKPSLPQTLPYNSLYYVMPKPRAYTPPKGFEPVKVVVSPVTTREAIPRTTNPSSPSLEQTKPRAGGNIVSVPLDKRTGHNRPVPDMSVTQGLSIDKHVDKQKYKIVYILDKLTDDLARAASSPRKKDKEYIKGLVWSVGVLFDKLANGSQQDALVIRIPARLLENVKTVIGIQAQRKAIAPPALDTQSSGNVIETTGYTLPVAEVVASPAIEASLDAPSLDKSMT